VQSAFNDALRRGATRCDGDVGESGRDDDWDDDAGDVQRDWSADDGSASDAASAMGDTALLVHGLQAMRYRRLDLAAAAWARSAPAPRFI
jgi:hypothetical protein